MHMPVNVRVDENTANLVAYPSSVCVIEENSSSTEAVGRVLESQGVSLIGFKSLELFLGSPECRTSGTLILDFSDPRLHSPSVAKQLTEAEVQRCLLVTGNSNDLLHAFPLSNHFATKFLLKPTEPSVLLDAVSRALKVGQSRARFVELFERINSSVTQLTSREKKVLEAIVDGQLNKSIAKDLDVSVRTVEGDRARIVEKFKADTTGQVVGLYAQYKLMTDLGVDGGLFG